MPLGIITVESKSDATSDLPSVIVFQNLFFKIEIASTLGGGMLFLFIKMII